MVRLGVQPTNEVNNMQITRYCNDCGAYNRYELINKDYFMSFSHGMILRNNTRLICEQCGQDITEGDTNQ